MEGESDDLNYDEEMDALAYLRSVRLVNLVRVRSQERGRTWLRLAAVKC
jgi:hypothetical protein